MHGAEFPDDHRYSLGQKQLIHGFHNGVNIGGIRIPTGPPLGIEGKIIGLISMYGNGYLIILRHLQMFYPFPAVGPLAGNHKYAVWIAASALAYGIYKDGIEGVHHIPAFLVSAVPFHGGCQISSCSFHVDSHLPERAEFYFS